jgi:O-antigen/teichoic acid export membrane protein
MTSIRRSLVWSFATRYGVLAIQACGTLILARLLTPADFGLFAVAVAFVALAGMIRDFGITSYVLQERELTPARLRTALGLALVVAWGMAALLVAVGAPVGQFYGDGSLRQVILVLALSFIIAPVGSLLHAYIRRRMEFAITFRIDLVAAVAQTTTAIGLAASGFGVLSLAWATFAEVAATAALALLHRPSEFRLTPSFVEWQRVLRFSIVETAANVVGAVGDNATRLIVGRLLGFGPLGLYSRAAGLVSLFNDIVMTAVSPVAVSELARHRRAEIGLRPLFLKALSYVCALGWPFFAVLALMAYPVVRILFGSQWDESVPLARVLCVASFVGMLGALNWYVFQATGAAREKLHTQAIVQMVKIALVAAAASHGLEAVTWAIVVASFLRVIVSFYYVGQIIGVTAVDLVAATAGSLAVTVCAAVPPLVVALAMEIGPDNLWLPLLLASGGAGLAWMAAIVALDHPLKTELHLAAAKARSYFPS